MSSDVATIDPKEIDSNQWYALYISDYGRENRTLGCIYAPGTRKGAVTLNNEAPDEPKQRWQLYPLNSSTYVLRNQHGGPNTFLGVFFEPKETAEGHTRPRLVRGDVAEDSVYWSFGRWGDGTYYLFNAANGSDWHYDVTESGAMKMSREVKAPQPDQRWKFGAVAEINNETFSSIDLLGVTASSPNTASTSLPSIAPTSTPTPSPSSSSAPSSPPEDPSPGLSNPAKAGIGAGVGIVSLIALIVLCLFLFRVRRQKKEQRHAAGVGYEPYQSQQLASASASVSGEMVHHQTVQVIPKHELHSDSSWTKYEMPVPAPRGPVEVEAQTKPVELPGR